MTTRRRLVVTSGAVSRRMHGCGWLGGKPSGAVRLVARKLASRGSYRYRNYAGHVVEADLSDYMERIGFFGAHSARLIRYLTSCLRPGDWAIDAGANVGLFSSPMAAAVGPAGCVWAVEPLPANIRRLQALKSANALAQLEIFPTALSATESIARLRLSSRPGGSGSASLVAPWSRHEYVEVATARLDQLVGDRQPDRPLRVMKIDVEGFEAELLAGGHETLTTMRPLIVCEFHDALLRAAGSSSGILLRVFAELGYIPSPPFGRPPGSLDGRVVDMLLRPIEDPSI